jgi:mannose-1-phosphate guanylyltransferase
MDKNNYCVIMAGGVGSRFWPISKTRKGQNNFWILWETEEPCLQQTFDRFLKLCPVENIFIVTNEVYSGKVAEQLPELKCKSDFRRTSQKKYSSLYCICQFKNQATK